MKLSIANDFTPYPDGRYRDEGDYCGEIFRENKLIPAFRAALSEETTLEVSLDGVKILGTSFLEEAFGGLVRELTAEGMDFDSIEKTLIITADSPDKQYFVEAAKNYIQNASPKQGK